MRSFLFVPADSEKKIHKGLDGDADALIFDLEDAVAPQNKSNARTILAQNLSATKSSKALWVRINALDTNDYEADLEALMPLSPFGIVLPKCRHGADVQHLSNLLSSFEAKNNISFGQTKILAIATETAQSIFGLGTYKDSSARLYGMTWGAEDLMADVGAQSNKDEAGQYTQPFQMVRNMCLFGAASAGVTAVDAVAPNFRDLDMLRAECLASVRDGFTAKMAIHPDQIAIIHETFTPSAQDIASAQEIVALFDANPDAGVLPHNGKMLDKPHLKAALKVLSRSKL